MTVQRRVLVIAALMALPLAFLGTAAVERLRARDARLTLERVVRSQANDQLKERCESDPRWFLTGSLEGRPPAGTPPELNPDALPPRPKVEEQPFELFAFDSDFIGSSPATPAFPRELKTPLRSGTNELAAPFITADGTGVQFALRTGWNLGSCAILLGRFRPLPHRWWFGMAMFSGLAVALFGVAFVTAAPIERRIRRLAQATRASARAEYGEIVPATGGDEIGLLGSVFNEASADIRRRITDARDREEEMRRFAASTVHDVAAPMTGVLDRLADVERGAGLPAEVRNSVRQATREAYRLALRLQNLGAVSALRARAEVPAPEDVDLRDVVHRAVARLSGFAGSTDVAVNVQAPNEPVTVTCNAALFEQAVVNLLDNAIRYNHADGRATVHLYPAHGGHAAIRVEDDGQGVSAAEITSLMAIRRFRGDEARTQQAGERGLGLAVTQEVADRYGFRLDLRQRPTGGFEAELTK